MNPSRLETTCNVTLRRFVFSSILDTVPPGGAPKLFGNQYSRQSMCIRTITGPAFRKVVEGHGLSTSKTPKGQVQARRQTE
jgi:hypothetical protein